MVIDRQFVLIGVNECVCVMLSRASKMDKWWRKQNFVRCTFSKRDYCVMITLNVFLSFFFIFLWIILQSTSYLFIEFITIFCCVYAPLDSMFRMNSFSVCCCFFFTSSSSIKRIRKDIWGERKWIIIHFQQIVVRTLFSNDDTLSPLEWFYVWLD